MTRERNRNIEKENGGEEKERGVSGEMKAGEE